jgi:glycosyltransferase involved in cell wall biosynthesis
MLMSRRIRVLLAIGSLAGGGSERQLIGILKRIDRSRFDPQLYLLNRSGEFLDAVPDDVPVTAFSDVSMPSGLYLPGRIYRQQVQHLAETLKHQNIDVLYDRTAQMTLVSGSASQRARVPLVSTVVVDPELDLRENFTRFRWQKRRVLTRAYRSAAQVIANSKSLLDASVAFYGLDPARTRTISNGFDFDRIRELADATPVPESPGRATETRIVAIGRLQPQKGFGDLIEAARILVRDRRQSTIKFSIAGQGPDEAALRSLIDQYQLGEHVELLGFVPNPYPLLKSADVFCLSSTYEGMPNVLVEAMACGVPVVATNCPHGPDEILDGGRLGRLVPSCTPQVLAAALSEMIEELETVDSDTRQAGRLRASLRNARESVESRFAIADRVRELESILAERCQR